MQSSQNSLIDKIELTYKQILAYKSVTEIKITITMNKFALKIATNLLPCMDSAEDATITLIDDIEIFKSCLKKDDCIQLL